MSRQACLPSADLEWLRKNSVSQSSRNVTEKKKPTIIVIAARKDLSLLQKFQTSYFKGYRGTFAGLKQPGSGADNSPPSSADAE